MNRLRVLIVDDSASARKGLKALLSLWPEIEVVGEAAGGREAIELIKEQRPDVVLMDARMPDVDGLRATRRIKAQWPEVGVIVLTVHADLGVEALCAGADAFLVKGCPAEELFAAIVDRLE